MTKNEKSPTQDKGKQFKGQVKVPDPFPILRWISLHPDGAYATQALGDLIDKFYNEN